MKTAELINDCDRYAPRLTRADEAGAAIHGKLAAIRLLSGPHRHLVLYGNVVDSRVDERGNAQPKRVRVQRGLPAIHGAVLQPDNYEFLWYAEDEED